MNITKRLGSYRTGQMISEAETLKQGMGKVAGFASRVRRIHTSA